MGWYIVAKIIQSVLLTSYICCLRAAVLFWNKYNLQGISGNPRNPSKSAPAIDSKATIVRVDLTHLCISIAYIHKMRSVPACMWLFRQRDNTRSYRLQPPCMPILHVMQTVNALLTVVLNRYVSAKMKVQTIVITEKKEKVPKLKKKVWLRLAQLSWLNVPQLFLVLSLH